MPHDLSSEDAEDLKLTVFSNRMHKFNSEALSLAVINKHKV